MECFKLEKKQPLTIKFKRLVPHAIEPEYATDRAAGLDLYAADYNYDHDKKFHEYGTGIAIEIPEGYEAQLRPRSSISKTSLIMCNSPGTIDSDYRDWETDRKSTRLNSSHSGESRMPSSA